MALLMSDMNLFTQLDFSRTYNNIFWALRGSDLSSNTSDCNIPPTCFKSFHSGPSLRDGSSRTIHDEPSYKLHSLTAPEALLCLTAPEDRKSGKILWDNIYPFLLLLLKGVRAVSVSEGLKKYFIYFIPGSLKTFLHATNYLLHTFGLSQNVKQNFLSLWWLHLTEIFIVVPTCSSRTQLLPTSWLPCSPPGARWYLPQSSCGRSSYSRGLISSENKTFKTPQELIFISQKHWWNIPDPTDPTSARWQH